MFGTYEQLGYVTTDFDRAIALIRQAHGLGPFKETRDLTIGTRDGRTVTGHFAQAFKGDLQFEVIEPTSGDKDFYAEDLRAAGGEVWLHHIGRYLADSQAYAAAIASLSQRWPKVVDQAGFGGSYCYFDARPSLGHYLELSTFPPADHFEGVPIY